MGMKLPRNVLQKVLAQAGEPRPPGAVGRPVLTNAAARYVVEVDVPVYARSEANTGGSLPAKLRRKRDMADACDAAFAAVIAPGCFAHWQGYTRTVTLTRFGRRLLDDDNLAHALKRVRDEAAGWLFEGDDGPNSGIDWRYDQKQTRGEPFVRVRAELVGVLG